MPRSLDVNKLSDAVLIHATVYIFYCAHETYTLLVRVGEIDETLLSLDFSNCVLRWSLLRSRGVSESVRRCVRIREIDETFLSLDFSNCVLRWSLLGSRGVSESVRRCV